MGTTQNWALPYPERTDSILPTSRDFIGLAAAVDLMGGKIIEAIVKDGRLVRFDDNRLSAQVETTVAGAYLVGSNFRAVRIVDALTLPSQLASLGVPLGGDARLLSVVETPNNALPGFGIVGSNFRASTVLADAALPARFAQLVTAAGLISATSPQALQQVEATISGTFEVGTNYRARAVGGGVTQTQMDATIQALPLMNETDLLRAKARRLSSAPRKSTAKAVLAIRLDDHPGPTLGVARQALAKYGLPWSWVVNGNVFDPGYLWPATVGPYTWADVRALDPAVVEIVNHGATHSSVVSDSAMQAEIIGSRDRLRAETGQPVLGFAPPAVSYPGNLRFASTPLPSDETQLLGTSYHRTVSGGHAWALGTFKRPEDATGSVVTWPLDGHPHQHAGVQWIDTPNNSGILPGGIGDQNLDAAVARGHGVVLSMHAQQIVGQGGNDRMDPAIFDAFLARVAARRDAGELDVVTLTTWHHTKIGA